MAKKSKLLKKKWSQLSKPEKALFKSKSTFSRRKQAQLTINQGTPKKPNEAAVTAIQQDKGKLKPRDIKKISKDTGVSTKKITKLATNRVPKKTVSEKVDTSGTKQTGNRESKNKPREAVVTAIQQDKGKLKPRDIKKISKETGLSTKAVTKLAINRVPKKTVSKKVDTSGTKQTGSSESKNKPKKDAVTAIQQDKGKLKPRDIEKISNETGLSPKKIAKLAANRVPKKIVSKKVDTSGKKDGFDSDYDPLGDIEFPKGSKGKEFRKYKTQSGKIRKAAEKDLENRMKKSFKPEVLGKAAKLKEKFLGDPTKKPKKLTGRAKREYSIKQVEQRQKDLGIKRKPNFEKYKNRVEKIREGKGAAKEYAYSGRFEKLGKRLGVKYGEKAREKRTENRLTDLRKDIKAGPQKTYTSAADNVESQRKKGRKAMEAFKIG